MELKKICNPNDSRPYVREPFSIGVYTFYTDGRLIIRTPSAGEYPDIDDLRPNSRASILTFFSDFEKLTLDSFEDLPELDPLVEEACAQCAGQGETTVCGECGGSGTATASTQYNDYTVDCKTCDTCGVIPAEKTAAKRSVCTVCKGAGVTVVNKFENVMICGGSTSLHLAHSLAMLPNIKIMLCGTHFKFVFDGGVGVLMRSY